MKITENVYPFVDNPKPIEQIATSQIYKIMEKLNNGGELSTGRDNGFDKFTHKNEKGEYTTRPNYNRDENDYIYFSEINHHNAYKNGIYRLGGWIFDFSPHFNLYLVKHKYYGWQEHYAPNKTFIRVNSVTPSHILKIIQIDKE